MARGWAERAADNAAGDGDEEEEAPWMRGGEQPDRHHARPLRRWNLWIVDSGTKSVYQFDNARSRTSGSQSPSTSFALAAGNTNPQGIADPPAPLSRAGIVLSAQSRSVLTRKTGFRSATDAEDRAKFMWVVPVDLALPDASLDRAATPRRSRFAMRS